MRLDVHSSAVLKVDDDDDDDHAANSHPKKAADSTSNPQTSSPWSFILPLDAMTPIRIPTVRIFNKRSFNVISGSFSNDFII